ncbi:MAG TPA: type II secretion system F family protein [Actinocrinis sp.]|nr:type II secretion system F family protein [Actinocrinis sp.]
MASARWASHATRPTLRQVLGAAFAACAVGLFIGGAGGVIAGAMTGAGLLVFGSRRVSESETRARQRLVAAAPPPVDLFAAALAAGLLPADAASVVATAFNGHASLNDSGSAVPIEPVREIAARFAAAASALREGAEPEVAWRQLSIDGATAPVAAAALRASRTGAPASQTVAKAARDVWNGAEQAAQAQIRAVAVRATAPLALCFLPAFVLVGVVPTALGLLTELHP